MRSWNACAFSSAVTILRGRTVDSGKSSSLRSKAIASVPELTVSKTIWVGFSSVVKPSPAKLLHPVSACCALGISPEERMSVASTSTPSGARNCTAVSPSMIIGVLLALHRTLSLCKSVVPRT